MAGTTSISHSNMQASSFMQPPPGASPFQIGSSPLFKTAGPEPIAAPPINSTSGMSPFSIAGATPTNAPLTVGDVINQLPPEVVRAGALPLEQPLSLPPSLLENALRSGQAALPVFELYRVCPALFQVPISPQDPRLVPLPAAKLPGLIAQAREGQGGVGTPTAPASSSPFSLAQSAPAASPFQMAAEAHATPVQAFPMSPFAAASPSFAGAEPEQVPASSPFSIKPTAEAPAASPFAMMSAAAPQQENSGAPPASPFSLGGNTTGGVPPQQAASPFSSSGTALTPPAGSSPFTSVAASPAPAVPQASITGLFTPKFQEHTALPPAMHAPAPAMPFGSPFAAGMKEAPLQAEPATAFTPPPQSYAPAAPASMLGTAAVASGMAKLGFAAVLNGYSVEELGFNPAVVPAWITTGIPASMLQEQISSGGVIIELGTLIDGVSDLGFRNTLATAKRNFQVKLPQNEVFHALTSLSAAPASAPSPFGNQAAATPRPVVPANNAFTIQPGAPSDQFSRVEKSPPAPSAAPAMPFFASVGMTNTPAQTPASSPLAPMLGASLNPFAQSLPPAAPAPVSAFGAAQQPGASAPFSFNPPPAEAAPPQKFPASQPLFPTASQMAASAPVQPLAGAFQPFGAQPSPFASQPPSQTPTLSPTAKPFDPFAASSTGSLAAKAPPESGFSSAQLLGQAAAAPSVFSPPPAPEVNRAASPFAEPAFESFKPMSSFAPALDEMPAIPQQPSPASRGLFSMQSASAPLFAEPAPQPSWPAPESKPAPAPASVAPATAAPAKMSAVKHSFLGLAPLDTQTDQLLLRALLGTEEKLAAPRVVELLAGQTGLSACVCLHGSHVLSHADATKPDATEFQRQAPDIARQLRGLAPLIGIEGAETFTLNAGGRLLTFCFPGDTIIGVLHDVEPSTGLRDKITLIARELARMLG